MVRDNRCHVPKAAYIGSPVKHIAHTCHSCGKPADQCTCGGCHGDCHHTDGLCMAVVDDANDRVYLYGNIVHENYHVPGNQCLAWTAASSAGFGASGRMHADEWFEGEQDENTCRLEHTPTEDNIILVFLNGVKQREGNEYDYIIEDNKVHFNFYELLPTDRVEVMYDYGAC